MKLLTDSFNLSNEYYMQTFKIAHMELVWITTWIKRGKSKWMVMD